MFVAYIVDLLRGAHIILSRISRGFVNTKYEEMAQNKSRMIVY